MTRQEATALAQNIVNTILDRGLAASSWRDDHPAAYDDLLTYRGDLVTQATETLLRSVRRPQ